MTCILRTLDDLIAVLGDNEHRDICLTDGCRDRASLRSLACRHDHQIGAFHNGDILRRIITHGQA